MRIQTRTGGLVPPVISMHPLDDIGSSGTDLKTNVKQPRVRIALPYRYQVDGTVFELYVNGALATRTKIDTTKRYAGSAVAVPILANGSNDLKVRLRFEGAEVDSNTLTVYVDDSIGTPSIELAASADSGTLGDNITSTQRLTFDAAIVSESVEIGDVAYLQRRVAGVGNFATVGTNALAADELEAFSITQTDEIVHGVTYEYRLFIQSVDGTRFSAMSPVQTIQCVAPKIQGVRFAGASYLIKTTDLVGNADSKLWSMAFAFRKRAGDGVAQTILANANNRLVVSINAGNKLNVFARSVAVVTVITKESTSQYLANMADYKWLLLSNDQDVGLQMYENDSSVLAGGGTYTVGQVLDLAAGAWTFGATVAGSASALMNADVGGFRFWPGLKIDWSVEANRREVFDASARAVAIDDSALPAALIEFDGPVANWHVNKNAAAGGFVLSGPLIAADFNPAE